MDRNRVLRNTVLSMIAASTVVGSASIGRADDIATTTSAGTAEAPGTAGGPAASEEATQTGKVAAVAVSPQVRRVHRAVWVTRTVPKVRTAARTSKSRNKAIASRLVARRSWSRDQFQCLDSLWTRESNWNHQAHNPSSGAYGIPQALPGSKMRGVGGDWRSNPVTQIHWGLRYIKSRYGSPCGAWGHFRSRNWY
ncbi:lytic transglycosylase domain-containing protein [Streptosporangium sp. NPDC001559]|uniref:aggregation-promoting factor C-terminal-like domain-containing protein n=1 Tax=Streptosporangium sp. NPDC001559 TaxID=3366187 RepID=UPI0036E723A6